MSRVVPEQCRGGQGVQPAFLSIANAYTIQPQAAPMRPPGYSNNFNTDNRRGMRFIPHAFMPKRTDIHSVLIIGAGPIIIGQSCEFDYSGTQACKALKEEGYRVILVNSNPATIMTDPEFADRTYIEPITPECI